MTALPAKTDFTGNVTKGQFKSALNDLRDYLAGLLASTGATSDARTALGLGSASTYDVGTSTNQIPDNNALTGVLHSVVEPGACTVFLQATAPTGWVQRTDISDRVIRILGTTTGGGSLGGNGWVISGFSSTISIAGHAITISELPSHNHGGGSHGHTVSSVEVDHYPTTWNEALSGRYTGEQFYNPAGPLSVTVNASGFIITPQGGGAPHAHPGSTSTIRHDGSWRPAYTNCILAWRQQ